MSDLRERMHVLDGIEPPELWSRVGTHMPNPHAEPVFRPARAIVALLVAFAVTATVYLAARNTVDEPIGPPGPKPNGPIYFVGGERAPSLFGTFSLYAVNPDGTNFREIRLADGVSVSYDIDVSPNGRSIATSIGGVESGPSHIFVLESDGSKLRQITEGPPGSDMGHPFPQELHPGWSPDGQQIVFVSTRWDTETRLGNYALFVVRSDGSGLRQLTDGSASVWAPAWSPDGSLIAYGAHLGAIWVIAADGSNPRGLLTAGRFIKGLAWSPDGEEIAFATGGQSIEGPASTWESKPEDFQIRVIGRDGSGERTIYTCKEVCRFGGYGHGVQWSPDGKEIAFVFGRVLRHEIVWRVGLVAPDGSGFRVLDTHDVQVSDVSWVPAS